MVMRSVLPVIVIIALIVMVMSFLFPSALRGAGDTGTLAALIQLLMVGILVGAGLFGNRGDDKVGIGTSIKYGAIWLGIGIFLVGAYSQRDTFAELWADITGEISPSSAQASGESVTLRKAADGHFHARVQINGKVIEMLVDTGATDIALDPEDAKRVGIDTQALAFNIPISTANGPSRAAGIELEAVKLGAISRANVPAIVMQASGGVSLLGMGFLGELSEVKASGDTLTLTD
jgi:aspartyl protease family protein